MILLYPRKSNYLLKNFLEGSSEGGPCRRISGNSLWKPLFPPKNFKPTALPSLLTETVQRNVKQIPRLHQKPFARNIKQIPLLHQKKSISVLPIMKSVVIIGLKHFFVVRMMGMYLVPNVIVAKIGTVDITKLLWPNMLVGNCVLNATTIIKRNVKIRKNVISFCVKIKYTEIVNIVIWPAVLIIYRM
jgi:hypothetical protein